MSRVSNQCDTKQHQKKLPGYFYKLDFMANYGMGSILSDAIFLFSKNDFLIILCPLKSFKTHVLCQTEVCTYLSSIALDMSVSTNR